MKICTFFVPYQYGKLANMNLIYLEIVMILRISVKAKVGVHAPSPLPDFADIKKRTEAEIYNLHTHIFGPSAASEFN